MATKIAPAQQEMVMTPGSGGIEHFTPAQQKMGDDIFQGNAKIMIKQEFAALECLSCEAKNRYRISVPNGEDEGPNVFLYINEDSGCCERILCSVNRRLTLKVHQGSTKDGRTVQSMHKPLHIQGCCICRPKFTVYSGESKEGSIIGTIEDPFACCKMDQRIKN